MLTKEEMEVWETCLKFKRGLFWIWRKREGAEGGALHFDRLDKVALAKTLFMAMFLPLASSGRSRKRKEGWGVRDRSVTVDQPVPMSQQSLGQALKMSRRFNSLTSDNFQIQHSIDQYLVLAGDMAGGS